MTSSSNVLLGFKEKLQENLSSDQIAATLDDLIFRALKPIMFGTDHVEQTLSEMLPFVASNARRKLSVLPQTDFVDLIFSFIVGHDKKAKFKILQAMRIERSITFNCLKSFAMISEHYVTLLKQYFSLYEWQRKERYAIMQHLRNIERRVGLRKGKSMLDIHARSSFWCDQAFTFKRMIIEKFIRLAYTDSEKALGETSLLIDADELFKDYVLVIDKAIDKYDSSKGTLTSYIRWWFMDARTPYQNSHEYGVSFQIPTAQRKKLLADGSVIGNFSAQIDDDITSIREDAENDALNKLIAAQTHERIGNIAIRADTYKLASLISDIQYNLSPQEIQALRSTMKRPSKSKTA